MTHFWSAIVLSRAWYQTKRRISRLLFSTGLGYPIPRREPQLNRILEKKNMFFQISTVDKLTWHHGVCQINKLRDLPTCQGQSWYFLKLRPLVWNWTVRISKIKKFTHACWKGTVLCRIGKCECIKILRPGGGQCGQLLDRRFDWRAWKNNFNAKGSLNWSSRWLCCTLLENCHVVLKGLLLQALYYGILPLVGTKIFAPNRFANEGANATMEQPSLTVCHATFGNITRAHNKQTSTAKDTTNRTKKNQADHHGDSPSLNMFIFFGLARPNRFKMSTVLKKDIGTNNQKLIVQKFLVNKIVCLAVFDPYSRWNCALQA